MVAEEIGRLYARQAALADVNRLLRRLSSVQTCRRDISLLRVQRELGDAPDSHQLPQCDNKRLLRGILNR